MNIFQTVKGWINDTYLDVIILTLIAGGTYIAICIFLILFSKEREIIKGAVLWLKRIVIAMIGIVIFTIICALLSFI